jgi:hypothetical protein
MTTKISTLCELSQQTTQVQYLMDSLWIAVTSYPDPLPPIIRANLLAITALIEEVKTDLHYIEKGKHS